MSELGNTEISESGKRTELFEGELPETLIILQRHTQYDSRPTEGIINVEKDPENWKRVKPEERNFGSITLEGAENAQNITRKRLEEIFQKEDPETVDFLFLGAETHYLGIEDLGQRAVQTADVELIETKKFLEEREVNPEEHILNLQTKITEKGEEKPIVKGNETSAEGAKPIKKTREADVYNDAPGLVFGELGGGEDFVKFLEKYVKGDFDARLKEEGVETAREQSDRVRKHLQVLARFSRLYHKENPEKKLVIFTNSHNDSIESFGNNNIDGFEGKKIGNNDAIGIAVNEKGEPTRSYIKGKKYMIQI